MAASWIIFAVASPLESRSSAANLFWISTWNSLLWCYNLPVSIFFGWAIIFALSNFVSILSFPLIMQWSLPVLTLLITETSRKMSGLSVMMQSISFFVIPFGEIHVYRLFSRFLNKVFIIWNLCRSPSSTSTWNCLRRYCWRFFPFVLRFIDIKLSTKRFWMRNVFCSVYTGRSKSRSYRVAVKAPYAHGQFSLLQIT